MNEQKRKLLQLEKYGERLQKMGKRGNWTEYNKQLNKLTHDYTQSRKDIIEGREQREREENANQFVDELNSKLKRKYII
jgi:hypothetical protein